MLNIFEIIDVKTLLSCEEWIFSYEQQVVKITEVLCFTCLIYFLGLIGILCNYKNFLVTMMSVELMYLGAISSFIAVSVFTCDPKGQIYGLILLIVAASESAIGLGLLVVLYRFSGAINFTAYHELQG